jgi:hypothetical protein
MSAAAAQFFPSRTLDAGSDELEAVRKLLDRLTVGQRVAVLAGSDCLKRVGADLMLSSNGRTMTRNSALLSISAHIVRIAYLCLVRSRTRL